MILQSIRTLFNRQTKVKLILVLIGYVIVSLLDMLGIVALVPLMALLTTSFSQGTASGITATIWHFLGQPSQNDYMLTIALFVALAFSLKAVFSVIFRWWSLKFLGNQQNQTNISLFKAYLESPYEEHRKISSSTMMNYLGWITASAYSGVGSIISMLSESFTLLTVGVTLFIVNPLIAAFIVGIFALVGGGFQLFIRSRTRHTSLLLQTQSEASTRALLHGFGGVKEVILRNSTEPFLSAFVDAETLKTKATRARTLYGDLPKYFLEFLLVAGIAAVSAFLFTTGGSQATLSTIAIFAAAGFRLLPSITRMLASLNGVLQSMPQLEKLAEEFTRLKGLRRTTGVIGIENYAGDICLNNVGYEYVEGVPVLSDINLKVPAGTSLALVGASGAGKSTLVDLLLGLQLPTAGSISCGGVNIHKNVVDWQARIGFVPQDIFLMDASLRENIVFNVTPENVDEERLAKSVQMAQLTDLVESSTNGLDAVIGERGVRLSGGQRQRIAIARALYKNPTVLILDEATSALDNETERLITETIQGLSGEITVIMVAHRLSTVKNCDQFLVLSEGRAEAVGTLAEVKKHSPTFAHLAELASI